MEVINLEAVTFKMPYFMYSHIDTSTTKQFVLQNLPNNYGYLLKRVVCSFPDVDSLATAFNDSLYIEFYDTASFKARQTNKIPIDLISTYCGNVIRASIPVAPAEYPVGELKSVVPLNFFYPYSDIINVQISGTGNVPAFMDIVLQGYFFRRQDMVY